MLRLEVMISARPDMSISYFISFLLVVTSPSGSPLPRHNFYCKAQRDGGDSSRQYAIRVGGVFVSVRYLLCHPRQFPPLRLVKSDVPEGIPLLLGDNGAQGVSFIYPGAHAPCLSPYHYAVVMAFDEVLLVPRAEAVHHVFVSQFQHPEVFGSLHPVVYIQFKEFAFHIQHRHGICLTGTFQYPEFFIQVFFSSADRYQNS